MTMEQDLPHCDIAYLLLLYTHLYKHNFEFWQEYSWQNDKQGLLLNKIFPYSSLN